MFHIVLYFCTVERIEYSNIILSYIKCLGFQRFFNFSFLLQNGISALNYSSSLHAFQGGEFSDLGLPLHQWGGGQGGGLPHLAPPSTHSPALKVKSEPMSPRMGSSNSVHHDSQSYGRLHSDSSHLSPGRVSSHLSSGRVSKHLSSGRVSSHLSPGRVSSHL